MTAHRHRAEVATPLCFRYGVFTQPRPTADIISFCVISTLAE
jgi:hypothetical protein